MVARYIRIHKHGFVCVINVNEDSLISLLMTNYFRLGIILQIYGMGCEDCICYHYISDVNDIE